MKRQKGITLIALVITIIVMLILVAVTINVALNGGIFDKAKQARDDTQIEKEKELLLSAIVAATDSNGEINQTELKTYAESHGFTVSGTTFVKNDSQNKYTIDLNGKITYTGKHVEEELQSESNVFVFGDLSLVTEDQSKYQQLLNEYPNADISEYLELGERTIWYSELTDDNNQYEGITTIQDMKQVEQLTWKNNFENLNSNQKQGTPLAIIVDGDEMKVFVFMDGEIMYFETTLELDDERITAFDESPCYLSADRSEIYLVNFITD